MPPLRALVGGGPRGRPGRQPARPAPGPGLGDLAQPGEGGRHAARASTVTDELGRLDGRRGRARGGRRLRADHPRRPCSTRCPWSTSTSPCCPAGGARRRSSGPSWPATRSPASASWRSRRASTPGRSTRARRSPIGRDERPRSCADRLVEVGSRAAGRACWPTASAACPNPVPQDGRAHLRREARPERARAATGPPGRELARVVRLGRAWTTLPGPTPRGAGGPRSGRRRRRRPPGTLARRHGGDRPAASELLRVRPEGGRPWPPTSRAHGPVRPRGERLG